MIDCANNSIWYEDSSKKVEIISLQAGPLFPDLSFCQDASFSDQAPVVQALDNAVQRIGLWMTAAKELGN